MDEDIRGPQAAPILRALEAQLLAQPVQIPPPIARLLPEVLGRLFRRNDIMPAQADIQGDSPYTHR